jgi:NitT/TauT family transport system substrate-binding protein
MIRSRTVFVFLVVLCAAFVVTNGADASTTLRFSLPPVMGSLPIALGHSWGLFKDAGVDIQVVGLSDNQARSLALMAGSIDGMICDVTTALLLYTSGTPIVITSTAYQPQSGSLAILSPSYFRIDSLKGLLAHTEKGSTLKSLALTQMSDLEYETDTLFAHLGYKIDPDKDFSYWHDMLQLATFLSLGSVYAAVLPEPYITYISEYPSVNSHATYIHLSDFQGMTLLPSVIVFRRSVVEKSPELITRFYTALRDAINRINSMSRQQLIAEGTDQALSLFFPGLTKENVPEGIMDHFVIPHFDLPHGLAKQQFEDVLAWARAKRYTWKQPTYEELTTDRFLK